jgi:TRAP-type C4-dicarboxylate transport system permease small subunit
MKKFYGYYCKFEEFVCAVFFISIVALVFTSAIARGLKHPIQWSVDISQLLLAWVSFLGADVAWRHGQLLGIDLLTKRFPARVQKMLELLIFILVTITMVIIIIFGFILAKSNWRRSMQVVRMSYSFVTLSLPVAAISMLVSTLIKIGGRIKSLGKN